MIQLEHVTKVYQMGDTVVRALDGVSLHIARGEFVSITGPSGSGKSTMMHIIGCLDRATAGTYKFNGQHVENFSDRRLALLRNQAIGFVFQNFNLINSATAQVNVALPLFYAGQTMTAGPATQALQQVNLGHRADHRPVEMSGGERQRVAIARAIVNRPDIIMADEPTGNLDSKTGAAIMDIFHRLNAEGVTIVLVTHEPDVAVQARRIIQMRDGKIVADGPVPDAAGHAHTTAPPASHPATPAPEQPSTQTTPTPPVASTHATQANGTPTAPSTAGPPALQTHPDANRAVGAILAAAIGVGAYATWLLVAQTLPTTAVIPRALPLLFTLFGAAASSWLAIRWARRAKRDLQAHPVNARGARRAQWARRLGWPVLILSLLILANIINTLIRNLAALGGGPPQP